MSISRSKYRDYQEILSTYLDTQIKLLNSESDFFHYSDTHSPQDAPQGVVVPYQYDNESNPIQTGSHYFPTEINYLVSLMVSYVGINAIAEIQDWVYWLDTTLQNIKDNGLSYTIYGIEHNHLPVFLNMRIVAQPIQYKGNSEEGLTAIISYRLVYCD